MAARLTLLSALALIAPAVAVAQDTPVRPACRACGGSGTLPCPRHGKTAGSEGAPFVRACSAAAACKDCRGALLLDCAKCADARADEEIARRRSLVGDWLAQRRAHVAAAPGHAQFAYLSTTHFELVFALDATTVGRRKLDQHALMHAYGDRLEQLRTRFVAALELDDADLPQTCRVYMFRDVRDHGFVGPRETGFGAAASSGLKLMGPEFVYSMWRDPRTMPDDESVHRNIVHHVTHLLLSQMPPMLFLGNKQHGWVDEGLAHWMEDQVTGLCTNFCFEEVLVQPGTGYKGGRWRTAVRKLVDAGAASSFAELSGRNTDQLSLEQHALAFAYVDFLLGAHGSGRFRDFVRLLKQGSACRDALQATYGLNPLTIQPAFEAWVREHYPQR